MTPRRPPPRLRREYLAEMQLSPQEHIVDRCKRAPRGFQLKRINPAAELRADRDEMAEEFRIELAGREQQRAFRHARKVLREAGQRFAAIARPAGSTTTREGRTHAGSVSPKRCAAESSGDDGPGDPAGDGPSALTDGGELS